jgi:putative ubiquitin-RnfH superfamily antitoxin RatB of RatAB toxin-antitoxin module
MSDAIKVEVVFGTPTEQKLIATEVPAACTVEQAIALSHIAMFFPEIDLSEHKVGIWNRTCRLSDTLKDGDRVEIYRPLIADPKEIRRLRAEKAKAEGRADRVTGGRRRRSETSSETAPEPNKDTAKD